MEEELRGVKRLESRGLNLFWPQLIKCLMKVESYSKV